VALEGEDGIRSDTEGVRRVRALAPP
jgi:hypothetical protein